MRLRMAVTLVCLSTACIGVEQRMTTPSDKLNPAPFRISAEQKARISRTWDADAVEKIANLLSPEDRRGFMAPLGGIPGETPHPESNPHDVYMMLSHEDPKIQALLDEMWAPYWETLPPDALTSTSRAYRGYPGRALALERRAVKLKAQAPK